MLLGAVDPDPPPAAHGSWRPCPPYRGDRNALRDGPALHLLCDVDVLLRHPDAIQPGHVLLPSGDHRLRFDRRIRGLPSWRSHSTCRLDVSSRTAPRVGPYLSSGRRSDDQGRRDGDRPERRNHRRRCHHSDHSGARFPCHRLPIGPSVEEKPAAAGSDLGGVRRFTPLPSVDLGRGSGLTIIAVDEVEQLRHLVQVTVTRTQ